MSTPQQPVPVIINGNQQSVTGNQLMQLPSRPNFQRILDCVDRYGFDTPNGTRCAAGQLQP